MARRELTTRFTRLRLLQALGSATDEQVAQGLFWYGDAADWVRDQVAAYGGRYSTEQVAGVLAVTSPLTEWERNKRVAASYLQEHARGVALRDWSQRLQIGANMRKAYDILSLPMGQMHTDMHAADIRSIVTGPKVSAFYRAILGDSSQVVIDSWHARVCIGRDIPTRRERRMIDRATRRVAEEVGLQPAEVQAIAWVVVRDKVAAESTLPNFLSF